LSECGDHRLHERLSFSPLVQASRALSSRSSSRIAILNDIRE
jgi:hypothetical protein